jgi:CheY-like chemotaxis protein
MPDEPMHVLVVEDERDVLDLLESHLQRLGCRVTCAGNGEDGLAAARRDPPAMAIVDIMLPGIDGREVIRQLRADPRTGACRIVLSSVLDPQDVTDAAPDVVLAKPFRRAAVEAIVADLVAHRAGDGAGGAAPADGRATP